MLFDTVRAVGLTLPRVEATVRYDGSPVLKLDGCFMAGVATHPSAEPNTLVVRTEIDARTLLLEEAPETYYVTKFYEKYPLVLARLSELHSDALYDLLRASWRLTQQKRSGGKNRRVSAPAPLPRTAVRPRTSR
jgi:hypothetical protein